MHPLCSRHQLEQAAALADDRTDAPGRIERAYARNEAAMRALGATQAARVPGVSARRDAVDRVGDVEAAKARQHQAAAIAWKGGHADSARSPVTEAADPIAEAKKRQAADAASACADSAGLRT